MPKEIKIHTGEWFPVETLITEETFKKSPMESPFIATYCDSEENILFHVLEEK